MVTTLKGTQTTETFEKYLLLIYGIHSVFILDTVAFLTVPESFLIW